MVLISNAESLQHNSNSTNSSIRHSYIACTWTAGSTFQSEVTVWVVPSCTGKTQTLELASSTTHYGCAKRLKAAFTDFDVSRQYTLTLDKRKKQCKKTTKKNKTETWNLQGRTQKKYVRTKVDLTVEMSLTAAYVFCTCRSVGGTHWWCWGVITEVVSIRVTGIRACAQKCANNNNANSGSPGTIGRQGEYSDRPSWCSGKRRWLISGSPGWVC